MFIVSFQIYYTTTSRSLSYQDYHTFLACQIYWWVRVANHKRIKPGQPASSSQAFSFIRAFNSVQNTVLYMIKVIDNLSKLLNKGSLEPCSLNRWGENLKWGERERVRKARGQKAGIPKTIIRNDQVEKAKFSPVGYFFICYLSL